MHSTGGQTTKGFGKRKARWSSLAGIPPQSRDLAGHQGSLWVVGLMQGCCAWRVGEERDPSVFNTDLQDGGCV